MLAVCDTDSSGVVHVIQCVCVCTIKTHTLTPDQKLERTTAHINAHLSMSDAWNERRSHEPELINLTERYCTHILVQFYVKSTSIPAQGNVRFLRSCAEQGCDAVLALNSKRPNANKQPQGPTLLAFFDAHAM